jgi:hypothetical protein
MSICIVENREGMGKREGWTNRESKKNRKIREGKGNRDNMNESLIFRSNYL